MRKEKICPICGKIVRSPRTKFCRNACYVEAKKIREVEYAAAVKEGRRKRNKQGPRELTTTEEMRAKGKKRSCLRCGREFLSLGAGNRICGSCNRSNEEWMAGKTDQYIYTAALWHYGT